MFRKNPLTLTISALLLAGCFDSGSSSSDEATGSSDNLELRVIDGYLRNAFVWLDINDNGIHDTNEPSGTTGVGGRVSLNISNIDGDPSSYPIIAEAIVGQTIDEDTITDTQRDGKPIDKPYFLAAPAGQTAITPLTTMVHAKVSKEGIDVEQAIQQISTALDISQDVLMSDYTQQPSVSNKASSLVKIGAVPTSTTGLKQDLIEAIDNTAVAALKELADDEVLIISGNEIKKSQLIDDDGDGIIDGLDCAPQDPDAWYDTDGDSLCNNADLDDDNDGSHDDVDAFPLDANEQSDNDLDGIGDNADTDDDNDGAPDGSDAFPFDETEQLDTDGDHIGDNADQDDDNDGTPDSSDQFPLDPNEQADSDGDEIGDNADPDDDNDGTPDSSDQFPLDPNEQVDSDGDEIGDNADPDDDNDGTPDNTDAFPLDASESLDTDNDGTGNNQDSDDDGDSVNDELDNCPLVANEDQLDSDSNGVGDACELPMVWDNSNWNETTWQ